MGRPFLWAQHPDLSICGHQAHTIEGLSDVTNQFVPVTSGCLQETNEQTVKLDALSGGPGAVSK